MGFFEGIKDPNVFSDIWCRIPTGSITACAFYERYLTTPHA
jgi:hypothetical protein